MPTREEIASWLREAGVHEANVHLHKGGTPEEADAIQEVWEQRAAKVEAMRCGSCAENSEGWFCDDLGVEVSKDFGCFAHEQKPAG